MNIDIDIEISDLETVQDQGTVMVITGTSQVDSRRRVTFAGDHRAMGGLLEAVAAQGRIEAQIEAWQVLSVEEQS